MTSLFSRLQKLNKEATSAPWTQDGGTWFTPEGYARWTGNWIRNTALIVECRNSLPAVLNLIEAADEMERALTFIAEHPGCPNELHEVAADAAAEGKSAVAVFVSGQEEPQ